VLKRAGRLVKRLLWLDLPRTRKACYDIKSTESSGDKKRRTTILKLRRLFALPTLIIAGLWPAHHALAVQIESTRVTNTAQHARTGTKSYPYRSKQDYILEELDLRKGDVVADIGAGEGWWTEQMAKNVGERGRIYALEVDKKKVEKLKKKFAGVAQIIPSLCEKDSTGLEENSCDLALFSQVFHHLDKDGRVDYLRHLRKVLKPTGRVVVIEKYIDTVTGHNRHGTRLSVLVADAEEAGWAPVRYQLMTGTYHYMVTFVQKDLFPPEPPPKKKRKRRSKDSSKSDSGGTRIKHTEDSVEGHWPPPRF